MPPLCKVFPTWLSYHISLGIVPVLCKSLPEWAFRHSNVLTSREVTAVVFATFPIVDAVFGIAVYSFSYCVAVAGYLANYLTTVIQGIWADWAGFPTPFPAWSVRVGASLNPVTSFNRVQF